MTSKTIALSGAEIEVSGLNGANAHIRNDGTAAVYAAKTPGIVAGADDVASIPAGQSVSIRGISGRVYLLGTGSVYIQSDDYTACPFKTSAQAGGSGADDVARAAISAHAGNADIHISAVEKASWDGKAELSDIPDKLPADGGNADTVDGKHAVDFALSDNPSIEGEIKLLRANNATTTSTIFAWEETARIRNIDPNAEKQTYTDLIVTPEGIYTEGFSNGEIKVRKNIADGGNADTLDGKHASDFANSATIVNESIDNLSASGFYRVADVPAALMIHQFWDNNFSIQIKVDYNAFDSVLQWRIKSLGVWGSWQKLNDGGNAATAITLSDWTGSVIENADDAPLGLSRIDADGANNPFNFWAEILTLGEAGNQAYRQQWAFPWSNNEAPLKPKYRVKDAGVWGPWQKLNDGGNAASVGTYTEAKIAALEARIAALEGGNV